MVTLCNLVCKFFILSQRVCKVDPPRYVIADVSTLKKAKYSSSCPYNFSQKVCKFFVSCQSVYEEDPMHVDFVHVTTDSIKKCWNEISLCRLRILTVSYVYCKC